MCPAIWPSVWLRVASGKVVGGLALSVDPYGRLGYDSVVTVPASPMAAPRAPDTVQSGIDEIVASLEAEERRIG